MAQTGYTPISIYYSSTAAATPTAGNLVAGELAINTADGKLFYKDSAGTVQVLATKGGVGSSSTTQVLYNSSGLVVGSANMTFDGTTLVSTGFKDTALTATRITYAGTGGLLSDSANLTYNGTTLYANALLSVGGSGSAQFYVNNATAGRTGVQISSVAGGLIVDFNGGGSSYYDANTNIFRTAAGTETMRISSAGNVGINTTDNTYGKLAVNGNIAINYTGAAKLSWANSGAYLNWIESAGSAGSAYMRFGIADVERVRIDVNGNVGIGATPSAWSGFNAVEFAGGNSFYSNGGQASIGSNAYNNGGWKYVGTGTVGLATMVGGSFTWYGADSGTAGNTVSSLAQILQMAKGYTLALEGTSTVVGTGLTFPATQNASTNANTLDDYEEGTWTPVDSSGAGLSFTVLTTSTYTKIGNFVCAFCAVTYPSTASGLQATIGGLPFTSAAGGYGGGAPRYSNAGFLIYSALNTSSTATNLYDINGGGITNASMSTKRVDLFFIYRTA